MSKPRSIFLFTLIAIWICHSSVCLAQPNPSITSSELTDLEAYNFVKDTCKSLSVVYHTFDSAKAKVDLLISLYRASKSNDPLSIHSARVRHHMKLRGLSPKIVRYLESPGYDEGLRECFPTSQIKRDAYTISLLIAEVWGTELVAAAVVVAAIGLVRSGALVTRTLGGQFLPALLARAGASESVILAARQWGPLGINVGVFLPLVPPIINHSKYFITKFKANARAGEEEQKQAQIAGEEMRIKLEESRSRFNESCFLRTLSLDDSLLHETFLRSRDNYTLDLQNLLLMDQNYISDDERFVIQSTITSIQNDKGQCAEQWLIEHPEDRGIVLR